MYSSKATAPLSEAEIDEILEDARTRNSRESITGVLVYMDDIFFQLLEGEKDVVHATMKRIEHDTRHDSIKVFYEGDTDQPIFHDWSMAFLYATPEQMSRWAGLPGTTTMDKILEEISDNKTQVPRLLVNILDILK